MEVASGSCQASYEASAGTGGANLDLDYQGSPTTTG